MKKFFTVFKFEFSNLVKAKPFIILTILVVLGIGIGMSYPRISDMIAESKLDNTPIDEAKEEEADIDKEMVIAVINNSVYSDNTIMGLLTSSMPKYDIEQAKGTTDDAMQMIKDGEYGYVLCLEGENEYTIVTESVAINNSITYSIDKILLNNYKLHLLSSNGLDDEKASEILNSAMNANVIETGKSQTDSFWYTYVLLFFLYLIIIVYGQMVATSVATEKSSRAMEVLITTVDPVRMMFGKVLGIGAAALCQVAVIVGTAVLFYRLNGEYLIGQDYVGALFNMPVQTIIISTLLVIIGFFVYAFLYAAIGSLVSRTEDVSAGVLPITFISIGSFMAVMFSMTSGNINSTLMKILTYFPLTSPYALLVRSSMTDVGLLEGIGAIGLLIITAAAIGYIAALIYKIGVLMYGKPPKLREVFKLIKTNK